IMKHIVRTPTSIPDIAQAIRRELPQYAVEIKRNALLSFDYIEVRKSNYAGTHVRLKNDKITAWGVIPSMAVRFFLGGLILQLATISGRIQVTKAVGEVITRNF
ncbi:MAG TPA: hypothetical protein VFJ43_06350, partial [Bacteroidia bacterium]|nr:hypothetical protein [Bacteroidia bacterium]